MAAYRTFGQNPVRLESIEAEDDVVFLSWLTNLQQDHPAHGMTPVNVYAEAIRDCATSRYAEVAGNEEARKNSAASDAVCCGLCREDVVSLHEGFPYKRWRQDIPLFLIPPRSEPPISSSGVTLA